MGTGIKKYLHIQKPEPHKWQFGVQDPSYWRCRKGRKMRTHIEQLGCISQTSAWDAFRIDRELPLLKKQLLLPELPIWHLSSGHKLKSNPVHSHKQHCKEDTATLSQCIPARKVQERKRYYEMQSWGKTQPSLHCPKPHSIVFPNSHTKRLQQSPSTLW